MYNETDSMYEEIEQLTKQMVAIPSVNSSLHGEKDIADFLYETLRAFPYFQKHPEYLFSQPLKDDALERKNIFALLRGEKGSSPDTLIFHGHIDTVGVEDYGTLKPYAFDCDALLEQMLELDLSDEIRRDLESGDYMVGRGACDMKSGGAVFIIVLKYLSEHPGEIDGNILLSLNPVEENQHTGIIDGLDFLLRLKEQYGLNYYMAINNDYICPLYPSDPHHYIYTGAVGKLLPCFYIYGKETHVGQCFEGFDASRAAAELVRLISLNPASCDGYHDEYTLPPSVLQMRDLKDFYNVQTAQSAYVYFNYFVHNKSMDVIIEELKAYAKQALENVLAEHNARYRDFCRLSHIDYAPYDYPLQVVTYDELYRSVAETYDGDLNAVLAQIASLELKKGTDKREIALRLTETLVRLSDKKDPVIVLFFAAPYCPHNTLKSELPEEQKIYCELEEILNSFDGDHTQNYEILQFFPSLSDSSYLKIDDSEESLSLLLSNFPQFDLLYPVPVKKIKALNIPAVNYGVYGKDAHKWSERVNKSYSFGVLPKLILETVKYYFQ